MTSVAVILLVNVVTSLLKKYVVPKWGRNGVHIILFTLATISAVYMNYGDSIQIYVANAIAIFSLAVALYEVLLSRFAFFKVKKKQI